MSVTSSPINLRSNSRESLADSTLRSALKKSTDLFTIKRNEGISVVPAEQWRDEASRVRNYVLDNLHSLVDEFSANATAAGAVVHRARDARYAGQVILDLLKDYGVRKIVKAKSMVSEEIHLNELLENHGIRVVETDLGEYIVQLAGETPSHILAPAIHKNRRQIGKLFSTKLGVDYSENPEVLTRIAGRVLRNEFLTADAGFSGANFAVSNTGSLVIFTNEGNGRMCTTVPPLHVAVLTIEKMLPSFKELALFSQLLTRFATGQFLSSYMTVITGSRKAGEFTGAKNLHIVLLDNGRSEILKGPFRDILKCIRCSACINVCPVYRVIGGHAYESTYSGPMGMVLSNLLDGFERAHTLLDASTLCGACQEVCPVRIPLLKLIMLLRDMRVSLKMTPPIENSLMEIFGLSAKHPRLYGIMQKMSQLMLPALKTLGKNLHIDRFPEVPRKRFIDR